MSDPYASEPSSRSGAHRPRRAPWRDFVPTVAVLLAVGLIGLGAWALTRSTASTITSSGTDDSGSTSQNTAGPTAPTTTGTGSVSSLPSTPATSSPPTAAVDRSTPVTVLNATRTSGLAASVAESLRSSGWTVPTTDNYRRSRPPTTVFYSSAEQRATAQAVADDVGGDPQVTRSSEFGSGGITVVIGSDYAG